MNCNEVFDIIYEALLLYIDDISAIRGVSACGGALVVSLDDGDLFQLSIAEKN